MLFYSWFNAAADTVTSLGMGLMIRYLCSEPMNIYRNPLDTAYSVSKSIPTYI